MNTINKLSCGVSIHEEDMGDKRVFVAECAELGISDFGDSMEEALNNLKLAIGLFLEEAPEKKQLLEKPEPLFVTRLFL
jgi:predicted RNase H-like HicB family nuclease